MKIAYVWRYFSPVGNNNISTYIYNTTYLMSLKGHDVYLITDSSDSLDFSKLSKMRYVKKILVKTKNDRNYSLSEIEDYSYRVYQTLKELNQDVHLDIIEFAEEKAEGFITIRAKKLLNEFSDTKLLVRLHSSASYIFSNSEIVDRTFENSIQIYAEEYCIKNSDILTSASSKILNFFRAQFSHKYTCIIPYPLESKLEKKNIIITKERIKKVIFVGAISPRKGIDVFIELAKIILLSDNNFVFEIYGKDTPSDPFGNSYKKYVKKRIPSEISHKIIFKGFIPHDEIQKIYAEACFCIIPSRWEDWPNVCLEAMSQGCVVIGSKHGGISEIIQHKVSGFLVDPHNPYEIALTILNNYKDISLLQSISNAAQVDSNRLGNFNIFSEKIDACNTGKNNIRNWIYTVSELKVSVIIPLFNQGKYVNESIESVLASSYKNIEIIVINDGSTEEYTNNIFEQLEGVIKIQKTNGGLASARNAGIAISTGELIMPLDADDKIHHLYIEKAVESLLNNGDLSYVTCHAKNFGEFENTYFPVGCITNLILLINTDGRCTNLYRKTAIDSVGGYDEELPFYEDWDLFIRLNKKQFFGDVLPAEFFFYRRHRDSMVYTEVNERRTEMIHYLMEKHSDLLSLHMSSMLFQLVHLWKTKFEVNQSVKHTNDGW